ncbi:MAG: HMA2 domain-containing protein [Methylomicrobium sp.]
MTDDEIQPSAFIKHQLPGRVRLKIPQKRGDINYFNRLEELFSDFLGINELKLNPSTASIVINHETDIPFQDIAEFAKTENLFNLVEEAEDHDEAVPNLYIKALALTGFDRFDKALLDYSKGRLDARSFVFLSLIGLAIHQAARGNVLAPASTFLVYAVQLLNVKDINQIEYEQKADSESE